MTETKTPLTDALWPVLAHGVSFASLATAAPAATTTASPAAAIVETAGEQVSYMRPNGEEYVPRVLMVGDTKMQDVTFVRQSIDAGLSVLLYGPPGTGKSALVEACFGDLYTIQGTIET